MCMTMCMYACTSGARQGLVRGGVASVVPGARQLLWRVLHGVPARRECNLQCID